MQRVVRASARSMSRRPRACRGRLRRAARGARPASPVRTSADLTCATVQVGWRCLSSAAAPATCGDAMLVPLNAGPRPSRAGTDERTSTPGAATSGFSCSEIGVGPPEEKLDDPAVDFARGRDRDRLRRRRRASRPSRARSCRSRCRRRSPGTTPASSGAVDRRDDDVAARLDLGLAEREVDHVHPVGDGGLDAGRRSPGELPSSPTPGGRDRQHLVVAEVRLRRDAGDAAAAAGRGRSVVAGGDPGDVGRVLGLLGVERLVAFRQLRRRGRERARDDHLLGRERRVAPSGSPAACEAARVEERVGLVDAVVEDPDLDPVARVASSGPTAPARRSGAGVWSSVGSTGRGV